MECVPRSINIDALDICDGWEAAAPLDVLAVSKRAGLRGRYPFDYVDLSSTRWVGFYRPNPTGLYGIGIDKSVTDPRLFAIIYLHEVGHLIMRSSGLGGGYEHDRFFAALVILMYRRVGHFDALKVYDLADNPETVPAGELVSSFSYALHRAEQFDRAGLRVEDAADWMLQNDYDRPARAKRRGWFSWIGGRQ